MLLARHAVRLWAELFRSAARSGLWWMPIVVPLLGLAALAVVTAKVVVPTAVYVFF
jgi:hypothetical protein